MKYLSILLLWAYVITVGLNQTQAQNHQHDQTATIKDTIKGSIAKDAHGMIGNNHLMIHYHSPAVRGRIIWGGLVAYDQVWVTGAHSATAFEFSEDLKINGQTVKAGKYALFTIPSKKQWTIILNTNWDQHLADEYDSKDDILRFTVKPQKTKQSTERLTYNIKQKSDQEGMITIDWEKIQISFPVQTIK